MKVLCYTTCGGKNPNYIDMVCEMIRSVRKHDSFDIAVITKPEWIPYFKQRLSFDIKFFETTNANDASRAAANRLTIFDYNVQEYSHLLYLDCDIIIKRNISDLFLKCSDEYDMYVFRENADLENNIWCNKKYTEDELNYMRENRLDNFNSGQFIVKNSEKVRASFKQAFESYLKNPSFSLYEQGHINTVCKFTLTLNYSLLQNEVLLHANEFDQQQLKDTHHRILHFCGCGYNFLFKLRNMRNSISST